MIRARTGSRRIARPLPTGTAVLLAALVAACGEGGPTPGLTAGPTSGRSTTTEGTPSPSGEPTASAGPTPGSSPTPTGTATLTPGPTPSGSQATEPATSCSGSDANRVFFAQAAEAVGWDVYCAVLPDGWFVESGSYRLADGGRLEVTYRGPGDAHVSIVQGNVCAEFGGDVERCAPRDAVIGSAAFGDRVGELGRLANGLVLDVDRGANPSWRATGLGLSEEEFRAICAALLRVEG